MLKIFHSTTVSSPCLSERTFLIVWYKRTVPLLLFQKEFKVQIHRILEMRYILGILERHFIL